MASTECVPSSQRHSFQRLLHLNGMSPEPPGVTSLLLTGARLDRFGYGSDFLMAGRLAITFESHL